MSENTDNDLPERLLDSLRTAVFETLETMAMAESALTNTEKRTTFHIKSQLCGLIHLTGTHEALLGISGDRAVIAGLISRIVGLPAEELEEEDLLDGIGELANMIGGGMKSKTNLPLPANLSSPLAIIGEPGTILWKTNRPTHLFTFQVEEGVFQVHASV